MFQDIDAIFPVNFLCYLDIPMNVAVTYFSKSKHQQTHPEWVTFVLQDRVHATNRVRRA